MGLKNFPITPTGTRFRPSRRAVIEQGARDMVDTTSIVEWLDLYRSAWSSDDPEEVARLFTEDVKYYTAPHRDPIVGRDAVVAWWVEMQESQLPWTFEYDIVARESDLYVVRNIAEYPEGGSDADGPEIYHNLWLVTLDADGRASEFVEYTG
jgi:hypothetical protein